MKTGMHTIRGFAGGLFVLGVLLVSCNQDPIFHTISQEVRQRDARIKGAPTNLVIFDRVVNGASVKMLFVASGRLHWYARSAAGANPGWDSGDFGIPQPGGNVRGLAVAGDYLYALTGSGTDIPSRVKRLKKDKNTWETVLAASNDDAASYTKYQSIFADPLGAVFIGASGSSSADNAYALLYVDTSVPPDSNGIVRGLKALKTSVYLLSGAASDGTNHFLSTHDGIYMVPDSNISSTSLSELGKTGSEDSGEFFLGMINLDPADPANIIAVARDGKFYFVSSAGFEYTGKGFGNYATGALAVWRDPLTSNDSDPPKLLLAGVQGSLSMTTSSGHTFGYRELILNAGKADSNSVINDPGKGSDTSVSNNERYTSTIGKHPVNFIFQAPKEIDDNMTLFASTQSQGLWSYRVRDGEAQWNAEE